jgi:cytochrome c-type biogenesis protein
MSLAKSLSTTFRETNLLRSVVLPVLVAATAYALAVVGAYLLRDTQGIDGVNGFVEVLSGGSGSFLVGVGLFLPLGFAFAAGMVSAVNPCGFAMLPAYLGLYLGSGDQTRPDNNPLRQVGQAMLVGLSVTAGFVVLFGLAGILLSLGTRTLVVGVLPFVGLAIGVVLTALGAWLMSGGKLYTGLAARAASHMGDANQVSVKGYFLFGLSYGTASLSCTLPIFLTVIGTTLAVSSLLTAVGQFLLFAVGMGLVIMLLTIGMALFKGTMVRWLRKAMPYVQTVGAWLMILAGAYLVFYWLTIGWPGGGVF